MTQQMLFTRSAGDWQQTPTLRRSDSSNSPSRRIVTFAKHSEVPLPVVDQSRAQSGYSADRSKDLPQQQRPHSETKTQRSVSSAKSLTVKVPPRKPGWDADVTKLSLFDASLKKSLLFQPQAGDRSNEVKKLEVASRRGMKRKQMNATRPVPVRHRSGPSSVYAQQRQSAQHWPQRKPKDFVRQNIVQLAGPPVNTHFKRGKTPSRNGKNVFKRLSTSLVSKTSPKSHALNESARNDGNSHSRRSPAVSPLPHRLATAQSPAQSIRSSQSDKVKSSSIYSLPQQSQQSSLSRRTPAFHLNPKNQVNSAGSRKQQDKYLVRLFGVLDRGNEKRIGVDQVLQGLQLLGLPATHDQISDYVYLIHEGHHDSIDFEEWEILVGTLDAASRPSAGIPRKAFACPESAPLSHLQSVDSNYLPSPHSSMPSPNSNYPRNHSSSNLPVKRHDSASIANAHASQASNNRKARIQTSNERESIVSTERQAFPDNDPYLEEIQSRIEGMFERAQATAALRWAPEITHDQFDDDSDDKRSNHALKRAASVVYSLRASLFPLVHQAEATLRELQQRHGSRLSLFLPPRDITAIANNSDVLATAILDDILLDTVQLLNDEDKIQTRHQLQLHHAEELDKIWTRIEKIEQEEGYMIRQGLVRSICPIGIKCDQNDHGTTSQHECDGFSDLTLPLEMVSFSEDNDDQKPSEYNSKVAITNHEFDSSAIETRTHESVNFETFVDTSILQGNRIQSIERRRHKFKHHRRLVESSLAETGMTQCAVIEMLEEMLLDDLVEQTAAELGDIVLSMSDTLLTNLL